jgi:hypothetical protein
MAQDFSKKISIAVRQDLPNWQVLNTVVHISAYFGNQLGEQFGTGDYFTTQDNFQLPRNTQYPIVALAASKDDLRQLLVAAQAHKVAWMAFIREMIETSDDAKIQSIVSGKLADDVELLGVGLFGPNGVLKELTKNLRLWK